MLTGKYVVMYHYINMIAELDYQGLFLLIH